MRHVALSLALLCCALPASANEPRQPTPAQQAQQEKMRQCNTTAKERNLQGDQRSEFMKTCLSKSGGT